MQTIQMTNMFAPSEHEAVRELLRELSPTEFRVLALRFWGSYSVEDISSDMNVNWDHANSILSRAMRALKAKCLSHPAFTARLCSSEPGRISMNQFTEKEI